MKFLLPFKAVVLALVLLIPTLTLAVPGNGGNNNGGGGTTTAPNTTRIVSEVDIANALVSNWFTANINNMPAGTAHYAFRSPSNDADVGYSVYLPPDYSTNSTKTYPVMYMLHGAGGNEVRGLWLATIVDNAIKAKQITPMIVVFPNAGGRSIWCNTFDGSLLSETMFINELVPLIDSKFRTIKERSGRFLEGFSMGGFGSAHFLFKYPELFSSAVTYGGAYNTENSIKSKPEYAEAFGGNMDYFLANSPYTFAQQYAASTDKQKFPVKIRTVVGTDDGTLENNRNFKALVISLDVPSEYLEISSLKHVPQPYFNANGIEGFNFHF